MIKNDPHFNDPLPNPGLPEDLPQGETLLWQGAPRAASLAVRVFHMRKVAIYFALLMAWAIAARLAEGQSLANAVLTPGRWLVPMGAVAIAFLYLLAWLTARTTLYTITSKRVALRVGIALTMTINVPFSRIEAADVKMNADGTGDIALKLGTETRIAYLILWPHARPWLVSKPEPMLRALADPAKVAAILGRAVAQSAQGTTTVNIKGLREQTAGGSPSAPAIPA